ncbi:hypothetical protein JCM10450v2_005086 [Rhodotorula kratochvilovae]
MTPRPSSTSSLSAQLAQRSIPSHLPRDILSFLLLYPGQRSDPSKNANLRFYRNEGPARPRRATCEELQAELRGNWDELEHRHDFVQWLFPIREQGVNWEAQPLEIHEVEALKADPAAMSRLLQSYRLMLSFYGLRLVSPMTGELALADEVPAPAHGSFLRRFANLERNMHNFLRVTRILKCLGEFGLTQHPPSLLLFLLHLQSRSSAPLGGPFLTSSSLVRSFDGYWRWCVRDDADRAFVVQKSEEVRKGGEWTAEEYKKWVERRAAEREKERAGEGEQALDGEGRE